MRSASVERTPSQIHSILSCKQMQRPIPRDKVKVQQYKSLEKIGISFDQGSLEFAARQHAKTFGMDSITQGVTTANIPGLYQFLQNWLPGQVHILTQPTVIDELVPRATLGAFEDESIVQTILEYTGSPALYGDYSNIPFSSWNAVFETRTIVRFEEGLHVGILESMRASRIQVDNAAAKRAAAARALEIIRNYTGFYGFNTGANNTYGFLNDPNLPSYVTVATGAASSTHWSAKTAREIITDILTAVAALRAQTVGIVDPKRQPCTLAVATAVVDFLSTPTDFGYTINEWLAENYPMIRVVSAPQLTAANGGANVFYLYADRVVDNSTDGGETFLQAVPTVFRMNGVEQKAKEYIESYSNATAGIYCKRPLLVVRYTGI